MGGDTGTTHRVGRRERSRVQLSYVTEEGPPPRVDCVGIINECAWLD